MALPSHRSYRLLQAIVRTRDTRPVQNSYCRQKVHRVPFSSCQHARDGYSVSFGPETDQMIESFTKSSKEPSKPTTKQRSSKSNDLSKTQLSTGSIEISLSKEDGDFLATKHSLPIEDHPNGLSAQPKLQERPSRGVSPKSLPKDFDTRGTKSSRRPSQIRPDKRRFSETKGSAVPIQPQPVPKKESWQVQKDALERKFGDAAWQPRKKLSPDAIQGLRDLHAEDPERYSTPILADRFKVSPEAIRRILKSKWRATPEEMEDRRQRWARRHDRIWDHKAALGQRPHRKQDRLPEGPEAFEEELRAKHMLGQI